MTPCEKLGYKVGDRFEVIDEDNYWDWTVGTIVILIKDDKTDSPKFQKEGNPKEDCYIYLYKVKPISTRLKTGDEITQDGKKYRVTLEEIPQYDFKPGMICRVDWGKADATCSMHSDYMRVVYISKSCNEREAVAYATTDGELSVGYVNTSSLRPE